MMKKIFQNQNFIPVLILLVTSSIVIFSWFKDGSFFGGGEESLSTWNPTKMVSTYTSSWIDVGLGYPSPFWLPRVPVYFLTYFLSFLFNPSVVQGILFWLLTSAAGIGMYLLAKHIFAKENKYVALFAGLFYILNLYTQSQVWARFIFAGFFAWASLPLLLFLWIKWFEDGKFKYLFLFSLFSVLFSSTYSHPAFIISFWFVAFLFSILKFKKAYIPRIVLGLMSWALINVWWIYPYFKLQSSVVSNIHDWKYDLASLGGVSVDSKIMDVLLLRHKFFFERLDYWGNFYKETLAYLTSFLILIVAFVGFLKSKTLKNFNFLWILALVALFVCKGTNPPFGNAFFSFLFQYVPLARVFRSSYEKFGTVWVMVYTLFFAYGLGSLYKKASKVWRFVLITVFTPIVLMILVWPMWKGGPFSPVAKVIVPAGYQMADKYLKELGITGRILSLPIIPGEGVKYNWGETSYYGLEPSDILFSASSVSKTVRYSYTDDKYMETYNSFVEKKDISKFLFEMDIEYLILHNEMESKYSNASASADVRETLRLYPEIKFQKTIGFLDIYKNMNYLSDNFIVTDNKVSYKYSKVNSGHYVVTIANADKPFNIILKNSFSPLWTAKINKGVISNHFVVYNYANGWRVDKKGDYTIDLVFKIWPDLFSRTH